MAKAIGSTKYCPKCNTDKTPSDFGPDRGTSDGLKCWCRPCVAATAQRWRKANPDKHKATLAAWRAGHKEQIKNIHRDRSKDKLQQRARRAAYPEDVRRREREWYAKNKEAIKARIAAKRRLNRENKTPSWHKARERQKKYNRQYYERDPAAFIAKYVRAYRARRRGADGTYTAADLERIRKAQRGKCAYCKANLKNGQHVDHVKPLIKGGSNNPSNLQLLCVECNLRKGGKDPLDYAQQLGRLL